MTDYLAQVIDQRDKARAALKAAEDELGPLRQRVQLLQAGVQEREALLTEARDLLEPFGGHGDDWPQIGPAIEAVLAELLALRAGEHVSAGTPLICSDERHAAKVAALKVEFDQARETSRRLNARCQQAESKLAAVERAVSEWKFGPAGTYVPLRSIAAIAKTAGRPVEDGRFELHYQRVERLEAELAALHEGEEPYEDERITLTAAQWIWQWNRATPEKRLAVAALVLERQERLNQYTWTERIQLHDRAEAAEARIEAVRSLHFTRGRNIHGDAVCNECSPLQPMPCPTLRALDGMPQLPVTLEPLPAEPTNAEYCPVCRDRTDLPYPFLCPGHPAEVSS